MSVTGKERNNHLSETPDTLMVYIEFKIVRPLLYILVYPQNI